MNNDKLLNQIKSSWNDLSQEAMKKTLSEKDLKEILRKKSCGERDRIRRKVIIEIIASAFILPIYFIVIHKITPDLAFVFDLFMLGVFLLVIIPSLRLIKIGSFHNQETKAYLKKFIYRFEQMIKSMIRISFFLLPAAAMLGFFLALGSVREDKPLFEFCREVFSEVPLVASGTLIMLLLSVMIGGIMLLKVYYKWMYQKHLDAMRSFLDELNEIEYNHENH